MAVFNKYNQFVEDLANKVHKLTTTVDALKVALTNTAPNAATHAVLADITQLSTAGGYTGGADGGLPCPGLTGVESGGILTVGVSGTDPSWTAVGATIGPFKYVVLYNSSTTAPVDALIGWWEYPSTAITLAIGETFTVDLGATLFTVQ